MSSSFAKPSAFDVGGISFWQKLTRNVFGCFKQIAIFFLSHLGLLALVIAYAVIGALIFVQLEKPNERNICTINSDNYDLLQESMTERLWTISSHFTQDGDYNEATSAISGLLNEFKDAVCLF